MANYRAVPLAANVVKRQPEGVVFLIARDDLIARRQRQAGNDQTDAQGNVVHHRNRVGRHVEESRQRLAGALLVQETLVAAGLQPRAVLEEVLPTVRNLCQHLPGVHAHAGRLEINAVLQRGKVLPNARNVQHACSSFCYSAALRAGSRQICHAETGVSFVYKP